MMKLDVKKEAVKTALSMVAAAWIFGQASCSKHEPPSAPATERSTPPARKPRHRRGAVSQPTRQGSAWLLSPPTQAEAAAEGERIVIPRIESDASVSSLAAAYRFNSRVFDRVTSAPNTIGVFRRGSAVPVLNEVTGPGCAGGEWYRVSPRGYVCTSDGVKIYSALPDERPLSRLPDLSKALPHRYAYVKNDRAPLLEALPTAGEHARIEKARETDRAWPKVVHMRMRGDYFVALDRKEENESGIFWKRVRGKYVYESDLKPKELPPMMGVSLTDKVSLPVAFIHAETLPVFRMVDGTLKTVGKALKHARVHVSGQMKNESAEYIETEGGILLRRDGVRIAEALPRPERVPPGEKWIHIDLGEQTLVAYEGEKPVFATLVSSGKEGHETVRGTFQIRKKFVTQLMNGSDPVDGVYDVAEVPWTMYFFKSFAIHGAYWHNTFGDVRSHGCVNLSPVDAKRLFAWTTPTLPKRWHGVRMAAGTYVHVTN